MNETVLYDNLNSEQKTAVDIIEGPLLILAGPGTGKTQLLSVRAANIMNKKKIPGDNILILTFTNSAAKAVKERLAGIIGFKGYEIMAETFHGFANSIILDSSEAAGYIKTRIQMEDVENVEAIEYILNNLSGIKDLRPFGNPYLYTDDISGKISELKNEGILPEEFENAVSLLKPGDDGLEEKHISRLKELSLIYGEYEEIKNGREIGIFDERGRYDYDDMILLATEVLKKEPALKNTYIQRYSYIMVDEFQDTNGAQLKLLFELLAGDNPNICCVGDDDQSIFRFQGAAPANFRIFRERFPGLKVIKLRRNYRSTKDILNLSSGIIKQVPAGERMDEEKDLVPAAGWKDKTIEVMTFSSEDEEMLYVIQRIKELKDIIGNSPELSKEDRRYPYNNIAVLVRKRRAIPRLIDSLLRAGIPYTTDGKEDISREKRVMQMLDVLRLARPEESIDEKGSALYKILTADYFEIPPQDLFGLIDNINKNRKKLRAPGGPVERSFITEFLALFPVDKAVMPAAEDTKKLPVLKAVALSMPHNLHLASWAVHRLLEDSDSRPAHDVLLKFIEDSGLYRFILREYEGKRLLMIRDLRALASFVNRIKTSSMADPHLTVSAFLSEIDLRKRHRMPVMGKMVSLAEDGVRILTAHASKGLEFHTVFVPFCLQDKSWPLKRITDRIPLPASIIKTKEAVSSPGELDALNLYDETRLFYVAASRAKANLIFTFTPLEDAVASSFFSNIKVSAAEPPRAEENVIKQFFAKMEEGDPMAASKNILKSMVKDLVLTPTSLNTFLRCRRKFLYNSLLLLPGQKKQSLIFGSCAHKALEDLYTRYKNERAFPGFGYFKERFLEALKYETIDKAIERGCRDKLPLLEGWLKNARNEPVIPIDLEKYKKVVLKGGIAFAGKFDKIEFEDESKKTIRIIDYKTGRPDKHVKKIDNIKSLKDEKCDEYLRQVVAYKVLYDNDIYERPEFTVSHGMLVFLEPVKETVKRYNLVKGAYVDRKVSITDAMVVELEGLIRGAWEEIQGLKFDKFPEEDRDICGTCDFRSICWEK